MAEVACGSSGIAIAVLLVATAAVSAMGTWWSILYARRRRLFDMPGQRRSHSEPTPRGGGIAIVAATIAGGLGLAFVSGTAWPLPWLLPPILGVAFIGWADDHGGVSRFKRIVVHVIAAAWLFALPMLATFGISDAPVAGGYAVIAMSAVTVAVVWSINLHNFMDGINGLLAVQALFVFIALAVLLALHHAAGAGAMLVCAAASLGFLPFNFPRARIFMGDVGSGTLGLLIAVAVLWQIASPAVAAASGLVLCSAFVTDASCTLVSRMLQGRRWYSAHREHLYQWLARCGHSHARVVALYMGWNLLVAVPAVYWMNRFLPDPAVPERAGVAASSTGIGTAIAVYALAVGVWWIGKRRCLAAVERGRRRHAAA